MVKRGRETKPVGELVFDAPNHYYDLRQDSVASDPVTAGASDDDWFNTVHSDHEPSSPIARRRRPLYVPSPERRAAACKTEAGEARDTADVRPAKARSGQSDGTDARAAEQAPKTMDSFELHSSIDCSLNNTASSAHLSMMSDGPQIVGAAADSSRCEEEEEEEAVEEEEEEEEVEASGENDYDAEYAGGDDAAVDISLDDDIKAMLEAHNRSNGAGEAKRAADEEGEIDFLEETDLPDAPPLALDEKTLRRLEKHEQMPIARAATAARRRRAAEGPAQPVTHQVSMRARAIRKDTGRSAAPVRPALDDDIAAMLKEHNRGVAKKSHSYVPPAHPMRLIRRWEAEMGSGEKWYTMAPARREEVNAEISRLVHEGVF